MAIPKIPKPIATFDNPFGIHMGNANDGGQGWQTSAPHAHHGGIAQPQYGSYSVLGGSNGFAGNGNAGGNGNPRGNSSFPVIGQAGSSGGTFPSGSVNGAPFALYNNGVYSAGNGQKIDSHTSKKAAGLGLGLGAIVMTIINVVLLVIGGLITFLYLPKRLGSVSIRSGFDGFVDVLFGTTASSIALLFIGIIGCCLTIALIVRRNSRTIGWVFLALGLAVSIGGFAWVYTVAQNSVNRNVNEIGKIGEEIGRDIGSEIGDNILGDGELTLDEETLENVLRGNK